MNKIQQKIRNILIPATFVLFMTRCGEYLELQPTDKVTPESIFSSDAGIEAFLANLYYMMPIEDFNFDTDQGFNTYGGVYWEWIRTDDATGSEMDNISLINDWWVAGYRFNKDVNLFFSYIPTITTITEEKRNLLYGEAYFLRAFTYFALARRYGGVPIVTSIAEITDTLALYTPRSTEKATWDFALASCDSAVMFLGDDLGNKRRVNKWTALALKSRIALHAASIAKYWDKAPLSGQAVDEKLVGGFTQADAMNYYDQCIAAAGQIMDGGKFSLYRPSPASPEEAEINYRQIFDNPSSALEEVIFLKGYDLVGNGYGSSQDCFGNPQQTAGPWPHPGRICPTLDLVDTYECYSKPGQSLPIVTTADGKTDDYLGYNPSGTYLTFDDPQDIFKDKDARMFATVITPGSMWLNTKIVIQGGLIQPDGTAIIEGAGSYEVDGVTYYTYGASTPILYSGFDTYGGNMTRTGFGFKKMLSSTYVQVLAWDFSTTDWIEMRYAEILLDYAEAVVESGHGDQAKAAKAINDLRKRAGHKTEIPLTLENVIRERRVELPFENKRQWDLKRRREFHEKFNNTWRNALVPVFDLRSMKYIFIRKHASRTNPQTFIERSYYNGIPRTATNRLIQNPQY